MSNITFPENVVTLREFYIYLLNLPTTQTIAIGVLPEFNKYEIKNGIQEEGICRIEEANFIDFNYGVTAVGNVLKLECFEKSTNGKLIHENLVVCIQGNLIELELMNVLCIKTNSLLFKETICNPEFDCIIAKFCQEQQNESIVLEKLQKPNKDFIIYRFPGQLNKDTNPWNYFSEKMLLKEIPDLSNNKYKNTLFVKITERLYQSKYSIDFLKEKLNTISLTTYFDQVINSKILDKKEMINELFSTLTKEEKKEMVLSFISCFDKN